MAAIAGMLAPHAAGRERDGVVLAQYQSQAESHRDGLLGVRRRIAVEARAAGLPSGAFTVHGLNTRRLSAVLFRVEEIIDNAEAYLGRFSATERVEALIYAGRTLIAEVKRQRVALGVMRDASVEATLRQRQLERLLVDTMRFIGAQGLGCFDGDPSRDRRYRLDHVYGRRTSKEAAEIEPELPAPAEPADA